MIGFNANNEDKKTKPQKTNKDIFKDLVQIKYLPIGPLADKEYKSSAEMSYEVREMVNVTMSEIAQVMTELGYKCELLNDSYYWVCYNK